MKKFWLSLGLTLMLACWCGAGYYGLGTGPAFGQDYYIAACLATPATLIVTMTIIRAPYADPLSQLLYYVAPPVDRDYRYQRQETNRERRAREKRERREHERQYQRY